MTDASSPFRRTHVELAGVTVHSITQADAIAHIGAMSSAGVGGVVVTPNVDHLRMLRTDAALRQAYHEADIVLADGMPLIWASRLQGTPLPERVAGSELIIPLTREAARRGLSIGVVGGRPGTADAVGERMQRSMPGLRVVHTSAPRVATEQIDRHAREIAAELRHSVPDILFVGLGAPKQERLFAALRRQLPRTWYLGVGAGLDMVAGTARKAPAWLARMGMEWLFRLAQEPSRLATRYLVRDLPVAARLVASSASARVRSG